MTDEELVSLVREGAPEQDAALRILEGRYKKILCGRVCNSIHSRCQFLAAVRCNCVEDFCGDVLANAILKYRADGGAKFATYLYTTLTHAMIDGYRRPKTVQAVADLGEVVAMERREGPGLRPGSLEHLALQDALDIARRCLAEMDERAKQILFWTDILEFPPARIRDIWPDESIDNIKQLKHRNRKRFEDLWGRNGGAKAEEALRKAKSAMAERMDPDRIQDKRAREAFRLWMQTGDLAATARKLKMKVRTLRKLLLQAMHDLLEAGMFRGGRPPAGLPRGIEETLKVVRAAFGFAAPEAATPTLGAFLLSRLTKEEDYDAACRGLELKPAALRKLLADEYEPRESFYERLSRFLQVPADQLQALPRRPAADPCGAYRSRADFNDERFHDRVLSWFRR